MMWLGILLACASPQDIKSCDVKAYMKNAFASREACVSEMNAAANYAASIGLIARPYCFSFINKNI